jgi:hypothetical protein
MEMGKMAPGMMPEQPNGPMDAAEDMQDAPKGGAAQLVTRISTDMTNLANVMDQSQAISDEDKAAMASVLQQFQDLVMNLGQAPGAAKPKGKVAPGIVPEMAGAGQVMPAV